MENTEKTMRAQALCESTSMSIDECIAKVEAISALYDKLMKGVVKFTFKKKDGSIRQAIGTLVHDKINYEFKGTGKSSPVTLPYWDLEKNAFRSLNIVNFIGMEE